MIPSSEAFAAAPGVELSVRRLGERTCVINVGASLRAIELARLDGAVRTASQDGCRDFVFDLSYLRRYETLALARVARDWDDRVALGCQVHVAVREPRVRAELERMALTEEWALHRSPTQALRALLSAPVTPA